MEKITDFRDKLNDVVKWNDEISKKYGDDFFKSHATGQSPWITLVSCCDSRVQTSVLLEQSIGEIFSVGVIGNAVLAAKGSVDYGIYHLNTPVLMILGHSDCGAVKACIGGYDSEMDSIKTALNPVNESFVSGFDVDVSANVLKNVVYQTKTACESYSELIDAGKLIVVGAYYDFANDFGNGFGKLKILSINEENV